jgi:hypothetical protein
MAFLMNDRFVTSLRTHTSAVALVAGRSTRRARHPS